MEDEQYARWRTILYGIAQLASSGRLGSRQVGFGYLVCFPTSSQQWTTLSDNSLILPLLCLSSLKSSAVSSPRVQYIPGIASMPQRNPYEFENQDSVPPALLKTVVELLRQWDDVHDASNAYLSKFWPDAILQLGQSTSTGQEGIRAMREATINPTKGPITNVAHQFGKAFLLAGQGEGPNESKQELIFNGTVAYTLKSGTVVSEEFASWATLRLDAETGQYKIEYYKVYIDQQALTKGFEEMANGV